MESPTFSERDMDRILIVKRLKDKGISQVEAASELGLSTRQVRRIQKRFLLEGKLGIKQRNKGGHRRYSRAFKEEVEATVKESYADFGPTFASEKLLEREKIKISKETLRKWMIEAGLWKGKKRKTFPVHQSRHRRSRFGEVIQLDGSHHAWFEGRAPKCCLLVLIDDASSRIVEMRFEEGETTQGYFRCLKSYLHRFGRPLSFYSDRHSIFKTTRHGCVDGRLQDTQFQRALKALDIELICAYSPQAKGRVERANHTLQDRLIKEMRLRGISRIEEANSYLPEFIEGHNKKFSIEATCSEDAHRPLYHSAEVVDEILSVQKIRKLSKNLEFSFADHIYQIQRPGGGYRYRGAAVTVCQRMDGQIKVLYGKESLIFQRMERNRCSTKMGDRKALDFMVDQKVAESGSYPQVHSAAPAL